MEKEASCFIGKCGHAQAEQGGSNGSEHTIMLKKSILLLMVMLNVVYM